MIFWNLCKGAVNICEERGVRADSREAGAGAGKYQQRTRGNLPRANQLSSTDALIRHVWTPISLRGSINKSTFLLYASDALAELNEYIVVPRGINTSFGGRLIAGSQSKFQRTREPLMQKDAEAFTRFGNRWYVTSWLSEWLPPWLGSVSFERLSPSDTANNRRHPSR